MARLTFLLLGLCCAAVSHAQDADRAIRKGNESYKSGDTKEAIDSYGKATDDPRAVFNMGNALYRQDSVKGAQTAYENAASMAKDEQAQARAYHNLGNSRMRQNDYEGAIAAYKEALKRTPDAQDTRYNLAYAQQMLHQPKKDDQKKDQDKKDQDKQQDQQPKPKAGDQGQEKKEEKPQDRIDPQDAKRMLDAAQQQEQNVQDKVRMKLQDKPPMPTEKDW